MIIIINFKNYVCGRKSLDLANKIKKYIPNAIVAVSPVDVRSIEYYSKMQVFSQNVDLVKDNRSTGFINPQLLKHAKAKGTLLNHSEHKIPIKDIKEILKNCGKISLKVVVCASNLREVKEIKKFKPYAIALEIPELISTGKSITKYNPQSIKDFVKILKGTKIIPLCGAGINSKEDIIEAKKLGCRGVLIASAIANNKNPDKILKEISKIK